MTTQNLDSENYNSEELCEGISGIISDVPLGERLVYSSFFK